MAEFPDVDAPADAPSPMLLHESMRVELTLEGLLPLTDRAVACAYDQDKFDNSFWAKKNVRGVFYVRGDSAKARREVLLDAFETKVCNAKAFASVQTRRQRAKLPAQLARLDVARVSGAVRLIAELLHRPSSGWCGGGGRCVS